MRATDPCVFVELSRDFIGMARQQFEETLPAGTVPAAIHFTGAAGNVAVGKYSTYTAAQSPIPIPVLGCTLYRVGCIHRR